MRAYLRRLRAALVLLLIGLGVLFAIGSTIERHQRHAEHPSTAATSSSEGGTSNESGGESGSSKSDGESGSGENPAHVEKSTGETGATILGVNTESLALTVIAVVASLLLALLVWLGRWPRLVLLGAAAIGQAFSSCGMTSGDPSLFGVSAESDPSNRSIARARRARSPRTNPRVRSASGST